MHVVILPGLDGTGYLLGDLAEQLSLAHEVTVIDYPADVCRYEDLFDHLSACLPREDYLIVAESFAGPLAVMIAASRPVGLKGIVFAATFARRPRNIPVSFARLLHLLPLRSSFFARLAQPFVMGRWTNDTFTRNFTHVLKTALPATLVGRLEAVHAVDVTQILPDIAVPCIYLRARHDLIVPAHAARDFTPHMAAHYDLEGPHFLLQAQPTQSAKHVLDFAARFA